MHWTALLEKRAFPAHARIIGDLSCIGCAYNLRGALARGQCSECGLDVSSSLYQLAKPDQVASGFRMVGRSFLFLYLMLIPMIVPTFVGMDMVLLGFLAMFMATLYRLIGASTLLFGASISQLPRIRLWLQGLWAFSVIETVLVTVCLIMWYVTLSKPSSVAIDTAKFYLGWGWFGATIIELWLAGRLGAAVARMLEYDICKRELFVQQIFILGSPVLAGVLTMVGMGLVMLSGHVVTPTIMTAGGIISLLLILLIGIAYTCVALFRLAWAAQQERESLDYLVDVERSELPIRSRQHSNSPDRQPPPDPPDIALE